MNATVCRSDHQDFWGKERPALILPDDLFVAHTYNQIVELVSSDKNFAVASQYDLTDLMVNTYESSTLEISSYDHELLRTHFIFSTKELTKVQILNSLLTKYRSLSSPSAPSS